MSATVATSERPLVVTSSGAPAHQHADNEGAPRPPAGDAQSPAQAGGQAHSLVITAYCPTCAEPLYESSPLRSLQHRANAEAKAMKLAANHARLSGHQVDVCDGLVTGIVSYEPQTFDACIYVRVVL